MTTTTVYGTWTNLVEQFSTTVEHSVTEALGDFVGDYDIAAVVSDYRAAINEALPAGVALCGAEFIGPAYEADRDWDGEMDIKQIVESIDFWAIASRHDQTAA